MAKADNTVGSVDTALELIEVIQEHEELGVTELAEELDLTKGSVHAHLSTLQRRGYVVNDDGRYRLGLKTIDLAHHIRCREEMYDIIEAETEVLAEKSGELALFTVEEQHEGVCLYKASGDEAVETPLYVGYRNDLYHTAVGKAILAFLPEAEVDAVIEETTLEPLTENTITDEDALRAELDEIRDQGFAYNRGETIPNLVGVGAPVHRPDGDVYGAISVIGPASRMTDERLETIAEMIDHAVNVIEINATSV